MCWPTLRTITLGLGKGLIRQMLLRVLLAGPLICRSRFALPPPQHIEGSGWALPPFILHVCQHWLHWRLGSPSFAYEQYQHLILSAQGSFFLSVVMAGPFSVHSASFPARLYVIQPNIGLPFSLQPIRAYTVLPPTSRATIPLHPEHKQLWTWSLALGVMMAMSDA